MNASTVYEIIGYVGSAFIVVSLTRKSILKLRLFGLAGTATFLVYALLIGAYPIAIVNVIIIGIHVYFLRQLLSKTKEYFRVLTVRKESRYLEYFLEFYEDQIKQEQPDFVLVPSDDNVRAFILRDLVPAGLFIGRICPDHSVEVLLDFVIPQYRDFRIGSYLYSRRSGVFADPRCDRAWSVARTTLHAEYLEKMGFAREDGDTFVKDLRPLHAPGRAV
jgi:hypothetical protein